MKRTMKILELLQQAANSLLFYRSGSTSPKSGPAPRKSNAFASGQTSLAGNNPFRNAVLKGIAWRNVIGCKVRGVRRKTQFIARSFANDAGARDYMLFVPSAYGGQPLPLIVMLHGCKQDPHDFATGTRMNELAEKHHCLVAYPAQISCANSFRCWNWFKSADQQRDMGEPSIIAGITEQVIADYRVDRRRVYIAGLSAGGSMAVIMSHTYPELYAAVGVHSGLAYGSAQNLYSAMVAMRHGAQARPGAKDRGMDEASNDFAISAIVFHGDQDQTVHPDNGDQVIAHSAPNSAGGVPPAEMGAAIRHGQVDGGHAFTQTVYSDSEGNAVAQQWVIHGAGHSWSGGDAAGSFTDPHGPDASKEMLEFFLAHPHPAA